MIFFSLAFFSYFYARYLLCWMDLIMYMSNVFLTIPTVSSASLPVYGVLCVLLYVLPVRRLQYAIAYSYVSTLNLDRGYAPSSTDACCRPCDTYSSFLYPSVLLLSCLLLPPLFFPYPLLRRVYHWYRRALSSFFYFVSFPHSVTRMAPTSSTHNFEKSQA